jgi:ankyrin repeat protein
MARARKPLANDSRSARRLKDAACHNKVDEVKQLLARGVDPNFVNDGQTALAWAAYHRHLAVVKELLAHGADPNAGNSYPAAGSAVHAAAAKGTAEILQLLLAAGGDPNGAGQNGTLPLHVAAEKGNVAAVSCLLSHGADPLRTCGGDTAMHSAARGGVVEIIDLLHERGVPIERALDLDRTPVHVAAVYDRVDALERLLELGASASALSNAQSVADLRRCGATKVLRWLAARAQRDTSRKTTTRKARGRARARRTAARIPLAPR